MWWYAKRLWQLVRWGIRLAGLAFIALVLLCFTNYPWKAYCWLSTDPAGAKTVSPRYIVVLGGGGIPSESGLVRAYRAAQLANQFPEALIVVALPAEGDVAGGAAGKTRDDLVLRGIAPDRIRMETEGRNTREQALKVAKLIDGSPAETAVLLVTSPYHVRRALLAFRKAGFGDVTAAPADSVSIDANLEYNAREMGGTALPVPNVGDRLTLRYRFWNNASYEVEFGREFCALGYYWLMRWI
ncbi:MAG: YdcF family protein [Verrucomicrobiota bacterium]